MMVSGNDAAVALAEYVGGNLASFSDMMNEIASKLNLVNTHFVSPHGLDHEEHYTTAYELALITDYALNNEIFKKIVSTSNYTIKINNQIKELHNTNELLGYLDGIYGVKTGFTNGANRCLVTSCKREDLDIVCVVLGCDTKKDRTLDSVKLINYIFNNYTTLNLENYISNNFEAWKNKINNSFFVEKGINSNIELYIDSSQIPYKKIAVNKSQKNPISILFDVKYNFVAPVTENAFIGKIIVTDDNGNKLFSLDILNKNIINRKNVFYYLNSFFKNYFLYY